MSSDDHLVELAGGWTLWREFIVRGAGFPAELVLSLSGDAALASTDALFDAEVEERRARDHALARASALPLHGDDDKQLRDLVRALRKNRPVDPAAAPAVLADVIRELADRIAAVERCRARAGADVEAELRRAAARVHEVAATDLFREAVLWQNRDAIKNSIAALLRHTIDDTDSKTRQNRALVVNYLQRYCLKNDTIGFFGPAVWGRIDDACDAIAQHAGPALVAERRVAFEHWAIVAFARKLSSEPELRVFAKPRLRPTVRIEGTTLHYPIERSHELEPAIRELLVACDGRRTARQLAAELGPKLEIDADELYATLANLDDKRIVHWTFAIPTAAYRDAAAELRELLQAIDDDALRAGAIDRLDELVAAGRRVAAAAGDPRAVDAALGELQATFERVSGAASTRRGGQTYAARTVVYEDCRRDLDLALGPSLVARLAPPLALLLDAARWYTWQIARGFDAVLRDVHARLARDGEVDYLRFYDALVPHLPRQFKDNAIAQQVSAEVQRKFGALLGVTGDDPRREVVLAASDLAAAARDVFAAPGPGWPLARFHSPDLMIAARGADAIRRGDYRWVIGEIHVGLHTGCIEPLVKSHPDPARIIARRNADVGFPLVAHIEAPDNVSRADHASSYPDDLDVEVGDGRSWRAPGHVLRAADLVVLERDGAIVVATRDRTRTFEAARFFELEMAMACGPFRVVPSARHVPRVVIDSLVVVRESWRFAPDELDFARVEGVDRFVGARRFARRHALPRYVFVRIPEEPKPCFVDLASPQFVEALARLARRATHVDLSEMLPAPDELWLEDADGRRYTSELRLAALDRDPWRQVR